MKKETALIIGAGPGGLTAAYELLKHTSIKPIVVEASDIIGGISCTHVYKGNRIDIGGHRFFSKSERVMKWWENIMPIANSSTDTTITYQGKTNVIEKNGNTEDDGKVMLLRPRKSRIYYGGNFFDYPISLSLDTIKKLGLIKMFKMGISYTIAVIHPIKNPKSLEDFYVNQFGRELYETFFREYTEKVWGVPCSQISAEWGAQRVKGLSIAKSIIHFLRKTFFGIQFGDKKTETSLIEQFLYPKLGPGQMWETVAHKVLSMGGEILMNTAVVGIEMQEQKVVSVDVKDFKTGEVKKISAEYFFSTMPVKELFEEMNPKPPAEVLKVGEGLVYRDFVTVGVLLKKLKAEEKNGERLKDTWIYIQEPGTKVGRIQFFNNWSPYLVADSNNVWLGMEYFCTEGDSLWGLSDEEMKKLAVKELEEIGLADSRDVLDATVIRVKKTYPGYFGSYDHFEIAREFTDSIPNLFLIGRNGMHKYNNQDHSMLTAMTAVENIKSGRNDKSNIWSINTEQDYHEEKKSE